MIIRKNNIDLIGGKDDNHTLIIMIHNHINNNKKNIDNESGHGDKESDERENSKGTNNANDFENLHCSRKVLSCI